MSLPACFLPRARASPPRCPQGAGLFGFTFICLILMILIFPPAHYFPEAPSGVGGSAPVSSLWGHDPCQHPAIPPCSGEGG